MCSLQPSTCCLLLHVSCRAAPYISGVLALWKQSRHGYFTPKEGWPAAAAAAFKNTAKPVPYSQPGIISSLMWPPAFVGAGTVQAAAAITNCVSISPPELLLQSGLPIQNVVVTLTNNCLKRRGAELVLSHKPAFALDIVGDWSRRSYDPGNPGAVPTAAVTFSKSDVTLDVGQSQTFEVSDNSGAWLACCHGRRFAAHAVQHMAHFCSPGLYCSMLLLLLLTDALRLHLCSFHHSGCPHCSAGDLQRATGPAGWPLHLQRLHNPEP